MPAPAVAGAGWAGGGFRAMRIDGVGGSAPLKPASRGRRAKGEFAALMAPDEAPAGAAAGTDAAGSATSATFVPAAPAPCGDPAVQDREARRHGIAMLDVLASLQCSLLEGSGATDRKVLSALAVTGQPAADPRLEEVLEAIAVRAAVELAKRG